MLVAYFLMNLYKFTWHVGPIWFWECQRKGVSFAVFFFWIVACLSEKAKNGKKKDDKKASFRLC